MLNQDLRVSYRRTASQVAQQQRTPLPMQEMQETWVRSLSQEDSLEKEMAIHSRNLAWESSWTELAGYRS